MIFVSTFFSSLASLLLLPCARYTVWNTHLVHGISVPCSPYYMVPCISWQICLNVLKRRYRSTDLVCHQDDNNDSINYSFFICLVFCILTFCFVSQFRQNCQQLPKLWFVQWLESASDVFSCLSFKGSGEGLLPMWHAIRVSCISWYINER